MALFHSVIMSQATQHDVVPQPGPIAKFPSEIIIEFFKFAVLSSEEARSHGAKTLCLVDKYWNDLANETSDLWTKVTLAYPLNADQLSAVQKWLEASKPKAIDVEIDFCDPVWNGPDLEAEGGRPKEDHAKFKGMIAALSDSEHRWRSISIKSDIWHPTNELLRACEIQNLPLLESISLETVDDGVGEEPRPFLSQESVDVPTLFGSTGTLMPKLRGISLSDVPVNWTSAVISLQNLCKLEIKDLHHRTGPTFEQFAALLAASPRLEVLDVIGYFPNPDHASTQSRTPILRLPALKHFVFGWTDVRPARNFLARFDIPPTLETLSLIDVESGRDNCWRPDPEPFQYIDDSSSVFEHLACLGSRDLKNADPSKPWISMLGLKSLSVSWVMAVSDLPMVIMFLQKAIMIEEIHLTGVDQGVLDAVSVSVHARHLRSLKRLYIWNNGYESIETRRTTDLLRSLGLQVTVNKFTEGDFCFNPIALKV